jgi:hypothetical protein
MCSRCVIGPLTKTRAGGGSPCRSGKWPASILLRQHPISPVYPSPFQYASTSCVAPVNLVQNSTCCQGWIFYNQHVLVRLPFAFQRCRCHSLLQPVVSVLHPYIVVNHPVLRFIYLVRTPQRTTSPCTPSWHVQKIVRYSKTAQLAKHF